MSVNLIRQELKTFKGYQNNRGSKTQVYLDANESPWNKTFTVQCENINRYPQQANAQLIAQLADFYQVELSNLLLTRGSDDGIDILIRLFCRAYRDNVIVCPPTFSMYQQSALLQGAKIIEVPLQYEKNFALNTSEINRNVTPYTKLVFICSPNNPTGTVVAINEILELCKQYQDQAMIVVDEAYIEFSNSESVTSYINEYKNLVVLRTLSKAFGVASLRCGVIIAQTELIECLRTIMPPFPFATFIFNAAIKATTKEAIFNLQRQVAAIKSQREMLLNVLSTLCYVTKVWQSEANFIFIQCENAVEIYQALLENGIVVREFFNLPHFSNCLRISLGLESQNQQLLLILNGLDPKNG